MAIRLSNGMGCLAFLLVLCLPGILITYFTNSPIWLVLGPVGIIILMVTAAAWESKRPVTPAQFADELESHLLGTGGPFDWDDTTSICIADERLERIRWELWRFDSLSSEANRTELKAIIERLRRGDLPEIVPVKDLTYR